MKKIWIKVEGIQLNSLMRTHSVRLMPKNQEGEKGHVSTAVKIGSAFNVNGITIESTGKDVWFTQNWALADARLLDVPGCHRRSKKNPLLDYVLGRAVHDFCLKEMGSTFRTFVEKGGEAPETPFFKPKEWGRHSLRIPVEFIKLRNFTHSSWGNSVFVDIQTGSHLIFWHIKICEQRKVILSDDRIIDPRLNAVIKKMLEREKVQKAISYVLESGHQDMESEFIDSVEDYNKAKARVPTPIRFY